VSAALEQALQTLPPEQRAVVHLKLWGDMTFRGNRDGARLSPNTAASRYRYGIDKLRSRKLARYRYGVKVFVLTTRIR
jgi:RNA polymerase sigma-70 factor (ECF subfamily)